MRLRRLGLRLSILTALTTGIALSQTTVASPPGRADVTLQGMQISIAYSRPYMRGRKIMGGLVPYGEVWRTGANEATTLLTPVPLNIGGANIPAGKYTLWTLPAADEWKLIINKQTGQWGTDYDEKQDLVRVTMHKTTLSKPVEEFTIGWDQKGADKADLFMEWENTRVWVPVEAHKVASPHAPTGR